MTGRHLTIIETRTSGDGGPEVETFSIRPGPFAALFSVLIGLIALALAFFILLPLVVIALALIVAWLVVAWARSTVSRFFGRAGGSGRRNVRVVGPSRGS